MAVEVRVQCEGQSHRVVLADSGKLAFPDHEGLFEDMTLAALGDAELPRCAQVLLAWREGRSGPLPRRLREELSRSGSRAHQRRPVESVDPLTKPKEWRLERRLERELRAAWDATCYRKKKWDMHVTVKLGSVPMVTAQSTKLWRPRHNLPSVRQEVTLQADIRWLSRVWLRGLAVVDGHLVMDVLEERDGELVVQAGRQGRGYWVYTCQALLRRGGDGRWHLTKWLEQ